ncbi:aminotransferase class I/II-fold pyridoxal phosphate-dependent enzyme, partial [Pantoea ananatis]
MNPALKQLHPYPFEKLRALLAEVQPDENHTPISLSIGEPKHPAPDLVKQMLIASIDKMSVYPATLGIPALREAIINWCEQRFDVPAGWLDASRHVLPVNGTREALFAFTQAVVEPNVDGLVVSPNPFYQIYEGA